MHLLPKFTNTILSWSHLAATLTAAQSYMMVNHRPWPKWVHHLTAHHCLWQKWVRHQTVHRRLRPQLATVCFFRSALACEKTRLQHTQSRASTLCTLSIPTRAHRYNSQYFFSCTDWRTEFGVTSWFTAFDQRKVRWRTTPPYLYYGTRSVTRTAQILTNKLCSRFYGCMNQGCVDTTKQYHSCCLTSFPFRQALQL